MARLKVHIAAVSDGRGSPGRGVPGSVKLLGYNADTGMYHTQAAPGYGLPLCGSQGDYLVMVERPGLAADCRNCVKRREREKGAM